MPDSEVTESEAKPLRPILAARLYPEIERRLIELLRSLGAAEWEIPTISPRWNVRNVAAHLLDTQLRKLSAVRDGFSPVRPVIHSPQDLIAFIDGLNEEGVRIYSRLSAPVLISLMETASRESAEYHQSIDPFARAAFPVSWAGEEVSLNWFDTARELTERWHHQQQIRLAVDRPGIMTPELYHPVLDCFMRGLPHAYRDIEAEPGTLLQFDISGECGGTWHLHRAKALPHGAMSWRLAEHSTGQIRSRVVIPQEIAWRIFTKGIDRTTAEVEVRIEGDRRLALPILRMTAIVG
jgi:uncharacterized protein (TIGR03083 family)